MVKASKFLAPTDKARKEARKKELKKNKKQRQQVRSAAIESKDPEQVMADLEKLDRFEFDVATNSSMGDSFYKDKRKRLKETWEKILAYYQKEDPDRHSKLKIIETEYEIKHKKLAKEFEAIKAAQEVKIEDVFLPPEPHSEVDEIADDDPLMCESVYVTPFTEGIKPPGCPPGLPPDFKQLVNSLRTSITMPEIQPLPQNLINLRLPQRTSHQTKTRIIAGHELKQTRKLGSKSRPPESADSKISASLAAKTTVIESKPVIFKPKATTKFLPSSLRSKLTK